jgi:hypothetical protein
MSTVLPPPLAAGLELVLELPPLLLLLQPTAAKAIAAKAAIAVVRLMIFLSLFEVVRLPPSALTGPLWAHGVRQQGGGRCAGAPYGGPTVQGVDSGQGPGPGECRGGHLARRFPYTGAAPSSPPSIRRTPAGSLSI